MVSAKTVSVPAVMDLGAEFDTAYRGLEDIILNFPPQNYAADIRIWDLLWRLADRQRSAGTETSGPHPAVRQALQVIEQGLAGNIDIVRLADDCGISQGHLARLFRREFGTTIVGHIQRRRVELAGHLLQYTNHSVKAIAAQVGIPDLQAFNKAMRKATGISPRKLRGSNYLVQR